MKPTFLYSMKLRTILVHSIALLAVASIAIGQNAQIPQKLNHQGRVAVGGTNFNGTGQFKFALVDGGYNQNQTATAFPSGDGNTIVNISVMNGGSGYTTPPVVTISAPDVSGGGGGGGGGGFTPVQATAVAYLNGATPPGGGGGGGGGGNPGNPALGGIVTSIVITNPGAGYSNNAIHTVTIAPPPANIVTTTLWSNDGTSNAGGEPTAAVALPVSNGLYALALGDTALANMTTVPASVFATDGPFPPGPFIGGPKDIRLRVWLDDGVHGFQLLTPDQSLNSAPFAYLAGNVPDAAITSAKIASGAVQGYQLAPGSISPLSLSTGVTAPAAGQVLTFTNDGLRWVNSQGWSLLGNAGTSVNTHFIGTTDNVHLAFRVNNQEVLRLEDDIVDVYATNGFSIVPGDNPMLTRAYDPFDVATVSKYYGHGRWGMFMESGQLVLGIPDTDVGQRGFSISTYSPAGAYRSLAHIDNNSGKFVVRGLGAGNGEQAYLGGDGNGDVEFGSLNPSVTLAAFWNPASGQLLNILARNATVRQLTINGGADLAEPFALKGGDAISKGSIVVIARDGSGTLELSSEAYDTRVAGIVSGANGINPGLTLHQEGINDHGHNVALTGRVYCRVDASNGAIKPGDLLTTSANPGHAMKATDHSRTQGAVLGKAMSTLDEGTGFVLVLVTLQ